MLEDNRMKRLFVIIMTTALLLLCASAVSAAGPVSLSAARVGQPYYDEEMTVTISADSAFTAKALYLGDFEYDSSLVELISGRWLIDGAVLQLDLDSENLEEAVIAFASNTTVSGDIFSLTFRSLVDMPSQSDFGYTCDIRLKSAGVEIPVEDVQCGGTKLSFLDCPVLMSVSSAVVNSYEGTVSVDVSINESSAGDIKTLAFQPGDSYEGLKLIGGEWLIDGAVKADWTEKDPLAVLTFNKPTELSGPVFRITYKILDNKDIDTEIAPEHFYVGRVPRATGIEYHCACGVAQGHITVIGSIRGDVNKDGVVNSNDAIYLLRHTLSADHYPINQDGDMNGDGTVSSADAIYLLRHVMLPDRYPLS